MLAAIIVGAFCVHHLVDFSAQRLDIHTDSSLEGLLPVRGPAIDTFKRVRKKFGSDDSLLIAWVDDELFSALILDKLKRFSRRARRINGVERVDSLATALHVREDGDATHIERVLDKIPTSSAALDKLKIDVSKNPVFGRQFISRDGRSTLIAIYFDPDLDAKGLRRAVDAVI